MAVSLLTIIGAVLVTVLTATYFYFKRAHSYWAKLGVETIPPIIPFGNISDIVLGWKNIGQVYQEIYNEIKGPYAGIYRFHTPVFIVKDPELIKAILVKDFAHFHDRGFHINEKINPLGGNLFVLSGKKWRDMRTKLTPVFTSGKLKKMLNTLLECGVELQNSLEVAALDGKDIEIKDYVARYTTDVIASVAFGIESNSLKNPNSEFRKYGKMIFEPNLYRILIATLSIVWPKILEIFRIPTIQPQAGRFMSDVVKTTIGYRENNNVSKNDFMQLMIELKNNGYVTSDETTNGTQKSENHEKLTLDQITAQALVFFAAGFETSSTTIMFALYEMTLNREIQDRIQVEIDTALKKHGEFTYEAIAEMEYLDRVISETLRKYPPATTLLRVCSKDYQVPNTDLVLKKGTQVVVPIMGLHQDPAYFPLPRHFKTDRFLSANTLTPYTYLPFGEGPRNCIGMRLGKLQTKIGIISILQKYYVNMGNGTEVPIKFSTKSLVLTPAKEMMLRFTHRKQN